MTSTEAVARACEPHVDINAEFKRLLADVLSARCAADRLSAQHDVSTLAGSIDASELSLLVASMETIVLLAERIAAIQAPAKQQVC